MFVVQFEKLHEQPSANLFERPGTQVTGPNKSILAPVPAAILCGPTTDRDLDIQQRQSDTSNSVLICKTKTSFSTSALGACLGSSCEYPRESFDVEDLIRIVPLEQKFDVDQNKEKK